MDIIKLKGLKRGGVYKITHERAGEFVAQFLELVQGDEVDPEFIHVRIDVRQGSGQERMAISTAGIRERNLRPSLVIDIESLPGEHWLKEIKLDPIPEKAPGLLDRFTSLFKNRSGG